MAVPTFDRLSLPILDILAEEDREFSNRELKDRLIPIFGLSEADLQEMLASGIQTRFDNRFHWALVHLHKAGALDKPRKGYARLTDRGRSILANRPERVGPKFLSQYPEYRAFTRPSKAEPQELEVSSSFTALDRMEGAFGELRDALNAELLTQLKSVSPAFFERLVVQLLVKMGYGGSIEDAGKAVGRSGDGGIDGVIKEDKLGLDSIFVQAKRWENNVGSGPVREFIGSLTVKRARKGVFLTTARFSPEAKECVKGLDQHIVLVDGERLASLMIENEVGVTLAQSYRIMKLDQDFFDE